MQMEIFENRRDGGRKLAPLLLEYRDRSPVVLAIPNGGVEVGIEVAGALGADLDVVVCRKIPIPLAPEGGMAAIADDGTMIVNQTAVDRLGLTSEQINYEAAKVRADIKQRSLRYRGERPLTRISGRTVILVDDGLASGVTMAAAAESVHNRRAAEIIVAAPVASATAVRSLSPSVAAVVNCHTEDGPRFVVSDYYHYWFDVDDEAVYQYLRDWRRQQTPRFTSS